MRRIAAVLAILLFSASARGDDLDATVRVVPSPGGEPPRIEVTMPGPRREWAAYRINAMGGPDIMPLEIRSDHEGGLDGPEPVAVAIVYCGQMLWIGNDDYDDGDGKTDGMLKSLEHAIDDTHLAKRLPPGSTATAISYSVGATVEVPMGPIDALTGSALGEQKHYKGRIGSDLVLGVRAGLDALELARHSRRLLIVIGDGFDTNSEAGNHSLRILAQRARQLDVHVVELVHKSLVSPEGNAVSDLTQNVFHTWGNDLSEHFDASIRLLEQHFVVFPTVDARTGVKLPMDGTTHEIELHVGERRMTFPLNVSREHASTSESPISFAMGLAGLIALVASIALYVRTRALLSIARRS